MAKPKVVSTPTLSSRELAAVLAGLRLLQRSLDSQIYADVIVDVAAPAVHDVYTNCGAFDGLDDDEISALCERLNFGG